MDMTEKPRGMQGRVIKWDGDPPTDPDAYVNPENHPACVEVVNFSEGTSPTVTYKRTEHGSD